MLSAAILAGGRAVRFGGVDKSALVVGGRTIFDRQLAELSRVADDIMWVGHPLPRAGVRPVADLAASHGPLGGLLASLMAARHDVVLVVACDMPYVSAGLLAYLASLARNAEVVVPQTERGYHPLCAAYTRAAIGPVARRLAVGRLKMTELMADVRLRIVTPEELSRFGH
ncbi:MAG: molybdenum cofactor guanylyltransferase, partial [Acidobacteriota bacterium]